MNRTRPGSRYTGPTIMRGLSKLIPLQCKQPVPCKAFSSPDSFSPADFVGQLRKRVWMVVGFLWAVYVVCC
jgi:hypothetical protein